MIRKRFHILEAGIEGNTYKERRLWEERNKEWSTVDTGTGREGKRGGVRG